MHKAIEYILAIPKTIYFNISNFGLKGLKFPVIVSHRTVISSNRGKVIIPEDVKPAGVRIGFGNVPIFDRAKSRTIYKNQGIIEFKGKAKIGHGAKIVVNKGAKLKFGHRFNMSAESTIYCCQAIEFGNYNLLSWNSIIMDSDLHEIYHNDPSKIVINSSKPIRTGESVWIGMRCTILKGVCLPNNTIVAANSNVVRSITTENCILGGNPASIIKENISWDSAKRDYV